MKTFLMFIFNIFLIGAIFAAMFVYETFVDSSVYVINENNKFGYINARGKEIVPPIFSAALPSADSDLMPVKFEGKWGYVDKKGELKILPQYTLALPFNGSLAYVNDGTKEGYINKKGKFVWVKPNPNQKTENTVADLIKQVSEAKKSYDKAKQYTQSQKQQKPKKDLADEILESVQDVLPQ